MGALADLKMYARFAWGLRGFLRRRLSLDEAIAFVKRRIAEREMAFLRLVERGIYGYPHSPYLPLLQLARCEFGDVQTMLGSRGLEATLLALREAGVYITFEEFKGREPLVRQGQVFDVKPNDFDNPYLKTAYTVQSGGSTGAGTRVGTDLDRLADLGPSALLTSQAHGVHGAPMALWLGILPDSSGINTLLLRAHIGEMPVKWFSAINSREVKPGLKNRLATDYFVTVGRLYDRTLPRPEPVSLDQAEIVAHWAATTLKTHSACIIRTHPSRALRVCLAAQAEGLDLTGAVFWGGGEPPTPAKIRVIRETGARWIPGYWITEVGTVGLGCAAPIDENDVHFCHDNLALIQYPRQVPGTTITVAPFYFTSLLPTASKILLNMESDDYGIVEERECGCLLSQVGYKQHLRQIRSFRKLTGEGVTLVGSDMERILEEVLPARFGGSPLDYQLQEEEDEQGFTRLSLVISPRLTIEDEGAVIETVLDTLRQSNAAADLAQNIWRQANTLRVKRMEPLRTERGKLLPLHLGSKPER